MKLINRDSYKSNCGLLIMIYKNESSKFIVTFIHINCMKHWKIRMDHFLSQYHAHEYFQNTVLFRINSMENLLFPAVNWKKNGYIMIRKNLKKIVTGTDFACKMDSL